MKNRYRILVFSMICLTTLSSKFSFAGNDDRRGIAGMSQLKINPWARSAGWAGVNTACGNGIDAFYTNVAGLTNVERTEVLYSYTNWIGGSIGINAVGIAQRLGEAGVLGLSFVGMALGDEAKTAEGSPENGSNGYFSPSAMNINLAYAHMFSTSIRGGANVKVISEGTDDVSGMGFAIDAGIQYVTGDNSQFKFGLALKNIGPNMSYSGDGLSKQVDVYTDAGTYRKTLEYRSGSMEMPTSLNIGASYDFLFDTTGQRLTAAANFTSNAFGKDDYILGLEYAFFKFFQVRVGYRFQEGMFSDEDNTSFETGLTAGFSFTAPLGKNKELKTKDGSVKTRTAPKISVEYAYRNTESLVRTGIHSVGLGLYF